MYLYGPYLLQFILGESASSNCGREELEDLDAQAAPLEHELAGIPDKLYSSELSESSEARV